MIQMTQAAFTGIEAIEQLMKALIEFEVIRKTVQGLGQYFQGRATLPLLEADFRFGQGATTLELRELKTFSP